MKSLEVLRDLAKRGVSPSASEVLTAIEELQTWNVHILTLMEMRLTALEGQSGRTNMPLHEECQQLIRQLRERVAMLASWPSDPNRTGAPEERQE